MRIGVVGVNFKSSELFMRELLTKAFQRCFNGKRAPMPSVLLSTCNRSELYFSTEDLAAFHSEILLILRREIELPFEHLLYSYFGGECFSHLASVTCGLDSAILAETEIQRQVKYSYAKASENHPLPSSLHFMFQKSLKIGKWVRTAMPLAFGKDSLEAIIFQISKLILKDLNEISILFVGNSEINRKILSYFKGKKLSNMTLCTRSPATAGDLGIKAVNVEGLFEWQSYDLVICGTSQSEHLISLAGKKFEGKTRVIFDLSMPRTVEPHVGRHPLINLFNIEEVSRLVDKKRHVSIGEVQKIETKVREEVEKQLYIFHNKQRKGAACGLV